MFTSLFSLLMGASLCLAAATPHMHLAARFEIPLLPDQTRSLGDANGGKYFDDGPNVRRIPMPILARVTLQGAERLDAITFTLRGKDQLKWRHGGPDKHQPTVTLELAEKEWVIKAEVCQGLYDAERQKWRIYYVKIYSNKWVVKANDFASIEIGKRPSNGNCETIDAPYARALVGAYGRAGDEIDQLGFIHAPTPK